MMSGTKNHLAAIACCWFMRRYQFQPKTVLNVGVGKTSPELDIWLWLLPEARLLGIDPRWSPRGHWTKIRKQQQLAVAVGDGTVESARYCGKCRSLVCADPEHIERAPAVPVTTIDKIVAEHSLPGPYFIWMDIDGSEAQALRGATETLKQTGWLNVEMTQHFGASHCQEIRDLLHSLGFVLHYDHLTNQDELYRNRRV